MSTTTLARSINFPNMGHQRKPGELVYADCSPLPSARNTVKSSPQTTKITFVGTLAPKAEVTINIIIDCNDNPILLRNNTIAAISLQTLLLSYINGSPSLMQSSPGAFQGFLAVAIGAAEVNITGRPGEKFAVSFSGFSITVDGIARPAQPTSSLVTSAFCSGLLPYGFVIVEADPNNPHPMLPPGLLDDAAHYHLPIGAVNSIPVGFVVRDTATTFDPFANIDNCCDSVCKPEGVGCNECYHILKLCCTEREISIPIEPFAPGTVVPTSLKGATVHYRNAPSGTNTQLGHPLIKVSAAADSTVLPMSNAAFNAKLIELEGIVNGVQMARVRITPVTN